MTLLINGSGHPRAGSGDRRDAEASLPPLDFRSALPLVVDLNQPLPSIDPRRDDALTPYGSAVCLVTLDGDPLGRIWIDLAEGILSADEVAQYIWADLGPEIVRAWRRAGRAAPERLSWAGLPATKAVALRVPPISVVIATRDRPGTLRSCLESILAGTVLPERLVVVDNASSTPETAELVAALAEQHPRIVYVREDVPGLARAHNAALPYIDTPFVAFTDDDVLVERRWLEQIAMAFADDRRVSCVTGMIAPLELDTLPQRWIEGNVTYDKGLVRRTYDRDEHRPVDPLFPFTAGAFGSGANMAFRTCYLRTHGGFDEALGSGTVAMGGDDLAAFYDVVHRGHRLVYVPGAIVLHQHHRSYSALRRQTYGYGAGLGAHLTRCFLSNPRMTLVFLRHVPVALRRAVKIIAPPPATGLPPYPGDLSRQQWLGMASGPFRYLSSRHRARRKQSS